MAYDLVIRDVEILDGTGAPSFRGDVAVADGRIAEVGEVTAGLRVDGVEIDGEGATLCPGLIDTHAHDDGAFFRYPGMEFKLADRKSVV